MRRAVSALIASGVLGCVLGCEPPPPDVEPLPTDERVLSAEAETVYRRTLTRDAAPSCADLSEGVADPVAALLEVATGVEVPAASPMRAATCLIEDHHRAIEAQMLLWVSERETMGLGLLVLNHLDRFEPGLRERLIEAARAGDYPAAAERRIRRHRDTPRVPGDEGGPVDSSGG